ncbi:MAG: phosphoserine phosphatase SerB [Algicola sp.]|nr:phosphoserine phosphatase SerB [Algicola sp.]
MTPLFYNQSHSTVQSEESHMIRSTLIEEPIRLVGFGPALSLQKIDTVVSTLSQYSKTALDVHYYQPLPSMAPAVVIGDLNHSEVLTPQLAPQFKQALAELAEGLDIELVVVQNPPTIEQPGVLLMDMDSTAIQIECIDEIAVLVGVGEAVAAVTRRAMAGELDFAESLINRVATLTGADESILAQVADNMPLMPGVETLINHLKSKNWVVGIASGGFTYFTDKLKERLGLTATFANQLEIIDGKLTGKVLGDIVDAKTKADAVEQMATEYGIEKSQTVAIGDGGNDLLMLGKAALGVAFHAKPLVRQQAQAAVSKGGLEQLLYLLLPKELPKEMAKND